MKRLMFVCLAAITLCACATGSGDVLNAAKASLLVYRDVYQAGVIDYGTLPPCPTAVVCHDTAVFSQLKTFDASATKAIDEADAVLKGTQADTGQLAAMMNAIAASEVGISKTGIALKAQ